MDAMSEERTLYVSSIYVHNYAIKLKHNHCPGAGTLINILLIEILFTKLKLKMIKYKLYIMVSCNKLCVPVFRWN